MTSVSFDREVALFLDERRRLGYSRGYLKAIRHYLTILEDSLAARHRPVETPSVVEADLLAALDSERARGLADSTLSVMTVAFRIFFASLYTRGRILMDPARNLARPEQRHTLGYVPTPADARKLLDACDVETDHGLRDRAVLELLYGSGLRIREAINLDVRDVDLAERTAFIKNAKGRKDRIVPITEAAAGMIRRYLEHVRPTTSHPALFVSSAGGRFAASNWRARRLRPLLRDLGLPKELTPHRLRHACAVHLLQNGADLRHIQKLLGHASISSTEIYLTLGADSLKRTIQKAHPREREAVRGAKGTQAAEAAELAELAELPEEPEEMKEEPSPRRREV
jgi:site-specific recombinase XerD